MLINMWHKTILNLGNTLNSGGLVKKMVELCPIAAGGSRTRVKNKSDKAFRL